MPRNKHYTDEEKKIVIANPSDKKAGRLIGRNYKSIYNLRWRMNKGLTSMPNGTKKSINKVERDNSIVIPTAMLMSAKQIEVRKNTVIISY